MPGCGLRSSERLELHGFHARDVCRRIVSPFTFGPFATRGPSTEVDHTGFWEVCNSRGILEDRPLRVEWALMDGRQFDTRDRVQIGAGPLRTMAEAGF